MAGMLALLCLVSTGMSARAPENLDYIIVLGARVERDGSPSPALRRRLDAALAYLENNPDIMYEVEQKVRLAFGLPADEDALDMIMPDEAEVETEE
jgi:hypothetical protein